MGGKPKVGYIIHQYVDKAAVSSRKHRDSHNVRTCQAKAVGDSSLTPHAVMPVKVNVALSLVCLDSVKVWLSCYAINWISILATLCRILQSHMYDFFIFHRCLFVELLNCYGVKLSNTLQTKLDDHLVISREDSVTNTNDLQQVISEPNSQLEQESKIHVRLYKSMTLEILVNIVVDLQSFFKPISKQTEFLVYFHLHDCTMFSKHLKSQIAEISAHSEQTGEVPAMTLGLPPVGTKQTSLDADEKKLLQVRC